MARDNKADSGNSVWSRLHTLSDETAAIAKAQAATDVRLASLSQKLDDGFRAQNAAMTEIAAAVHKKEPTNWIGYIMLALGMMGMFGAYSMLITSPISKATEINAGMSTSNNRELSLLGRNAASANTELNYLNNRLSVIDSDVRDLRVDLGSLQGRTSFIEGRHELLLKRTDRLEQSLDRQDRNR